jgi:prepilin-type N-terminal cleavage/methylation domain-containing protein
VSIHQKERDGFTIIEVVLVLAIAGLIFLMVFIALPALQRSQRDSQRKNDLSRAITAVTSYASNNRGSLPTFDANFITSYLTPTASDSFIDPAGANSSNTTATTYTFTVANGNTPLSGSFSSATTQNIIYYTTNYTCGVGGAFVKAGSRKVALSMYLEGGGIDCINN